jgi:hypothetical protein
VDELSSNSLILALSGEEYRIIIPISYFLENTRIILIFLGDLEQGLLLYGGNHLPDEQESLAREESPCYHFFFYGGEQDPPNHPEKHMEDESKYDDQSW